MSTKASATVIIINERGMHARPSSKLANLAAQFEATAILCRADTPEEWAHGDSIMGLLALGASKGTELSIACEGEQARELLDALTQLISDGFGEA